MVRVLRWICWALTLCRSLRGKGRETGGRGDGGSALRPFGFAQDRLRSGQASLTDRGSRGPGDGGLLDKGQLSPISQFFPDAIKAPAYIAISREIWEYKNASLCPSFPIIFIIYGINNRASGYRESAHLISPNQSELRPYAPLGYIGKT